MNNSVGGIIQEILDTDVVIKNIDEKFKANNILSPDSYSTIYEIILIYGSKLVLHFEELNSGDRYKTRIHNYLNFLQFIFSEFFNKEKGEEFFINGNTQNLKFRWMDLFHAPYDYQEFDLKDFLRHIRNTKYYEKRSNLINISWQWFTKSKFSLTSKIFVDSKLPKLLLITNDTSQESNELLNAFHFSDNIIRQLSSDIINKDEKEKSNIIDYLDSKKSELLSNKQFVELSEKFINVLEIDNKSCDIEEFRDILAKYIILTSIYESDVIEANEFFYYYYFPAMPGKCTVLSGSVLGLAGQTGLCEEKISLFDSTINIWSRYSHQEETERKILITEKKLKDKIKEEALRTARISIIVDSFAHNISSHSLSAIIWLFSQRAEMLNKRFTISEPIKKKAEVTTDEINDIVDKANHFYKCLELTSETEYKRNFSLTDIFSFMNDSIKEKLLWYSPLSGFHGGYEIDENIGLPIPLDAHLVYYFEYLHEKATFWQGATTDLLSTGDITNWYELIFKFANNPIFLGTIAKTENIFKVNINVYTDLNQETTNQSNISNEVNFIDIDLGGIYDDVQMFHFGNVNHESNYRMIQLGENFKNIKKKLLDMSVYLPNGTVGKHALFTIWENTLRNVKHIEKIGKEKTLTFNISITKAENDPRLYKVKIWLGNKTSLKDTKTGKKVKEMIEGRLLQPILNEDMVNMGGTSQDKICASMLYTNYFKNAEKREVFFRNNFYPWITIDDKKENTDKDDEIGYVFRSFHCWEGCESFNLNTINDYKGENLMRFKFIIASDEEKTKADEISSQSLLRIVKKPDNMYASWNKKWVCKSKNHEVYYLCTGSKISKTYYAKFKVFFDDNWRLDACKENKGWDIENLNKLPNHIVFAHGSYINEFIFERRTHGILNRHFFNLEDEVKNERNIDEFIETLLTDIVIYDNRIFTAFNDVQKVKKFNRLFLKVFPESIPGDDSKIGLAKTTFSNDVETNIAIIHLSYIEKLGYDEEEMDNFMDDYLKNFLNRENTRVIITTGRTRRNWLNFLGNYKRNVLFIPIESIFKAVREGLVLRDDFQVKYNLVKSIFGA